MSSGLKENIVINSKQNIPHIKSLYQYYYLTELFNKARIIVQEMTELLVLDLVDKGLVTDSLTLTIGYDRSNVEEGIFKGEVTYDRYGRGVPKSAHGTADLGTTTAAPGKL